MQWRGGANGSSSSGIGSKGIASTSRPAWQSTTLVERTPVAGVERSRPGVARTVSANVAAPTVRRRSTSRPRALGVAANEAAAAPRRGAKYSNATSGLVASPLPRAGSAAGNKDRRATWGADHPSTVDASYHDNGGDMGTTDDFTLRESSARIIAMLEEQALAQQRTADAAVERVMAREEEAIGLVADRRDRCLAARDRVAADVEAAARERDDFESSTLAAQRRKEDLEKALQACEAEMARYTGYRLLPSCPSGEPGNVGGVRRGPIWTTLGVRHALSVPRRLDSAPANKEASTNGDNATLAQREAQALRVAEQLREATDGLVASRASRELELTSARSELGELLALRDTFAGTENQLKEALRDTSSSLKEAASRRLRIPLLKTAASEASALLQRVESDRDTGITTLMERAKLDEAALADISALADRYSTRQQREEGHAGVVATFVQQLRMESDAIEQSTMRAVTESEAARADRERFIQDLRDKISEMEDRSAKTRRLRSELCL